ncbi:MAG: GTP-binding protein [Candidatus Heimdallarchaeum aukensis]|uniref:Elongation factor 2 n=1 Tax=Candidatus Heimdallarchaeum aukensis TaxID=2876573 RepID=A0A9Y1FKT8_9ARCH|nr:MAG: GTP-binding protein [Candidatus Heimdallarchaeum aukensis]
MVKVKNADDIRQMIKEHPNELRRVFSIAAHIDHGKTTTSDYLLRKAGLMSDADAGKKVMMDSDQEEQERGITIFTSVVLLDYEYTDENGETKRYLMEINDTPGHISFTGEVSRALRGSDGVILLVDALEGVMTQTETNIRLSIGEMCKPVLYINKVDRLISELRLKPDQVFSRIDAIITEVNKLIEANAPKELAKQWRVRFTDDSVAIGSAKDGWAFNMSTLKRLKIKPQDIFEKYNQNDKDWLRKNLPLEEPLLEMVIKHLPNPEEGQRVKIPRIWSGDLESPQGKALLNADPNGPLMGMITKIFIEPKSKRPTLIGRVYSGTLRKSDTLYLVGKKDKTNIKRLGVMEITDILDVDEIPAGNLFAIFGFICPAGETFINAKDIGKVHPFEEISYVAEPVVSRTIKPKDPQDIAKLGEVVSKWIMADPTAAFRHDEESKTYVLSGIDPLQIEILVTRIREQVDIEVSDPIIVYREKPTTRGPDVFAKSPNGHNRFEVHVEPLDEKTIELIKSGKVNMDQDRKERAAILHEEAGWDAREARRIWAIADTNILVDNTKGVQRLENIQQYIIQVFHDFAHGATLAKEPLMGAKFVITDAVVHVDPAHTGFSEIFQMSLAGFHTTFISANPQLLEPILQIDIKVPNDFIGNITALLTQHRGMILDMTTEGENTKLKGKVPTAETIHLADEIRSESSGKAFFGYQFLGFEPVPSNLEEQVIASIRERKGLPPEIPTASNWERFMYKRT